METPTTEHPAWLNVTDAGAVTCLNLAAAKRCARDPSAPAAHRLQAAIALHAFDCGHRRADIEALEHVTPDIALQLLPTPRPLYSRGVRPGQLVPMPQPAPSWFERLMQRLRRKDPE